MKTKRKAERSETRNVDGTETSGAGVAPEPSDVHEQRVARTVKFWTNLKAEENGLEPAVSKAEARPRTKRRRKVAEQTGKEGMPKSKQ